MDILLANPRGFCAGVDRAIEIVKRAIETLARKVGGVGGIILLDRDGRVGHAYNTEHMAYAYLTEDLAEPVVSV